MIHSAFNVMYLEVTCNITTKQSKRFAVFPVSDLFLENNFQVFLRQVTRSKIVLCMHSVLQVVTWLIFLLHSRFWIFASTILYIYHLLCEFVSLIANQRRIFHTLSQGFFFTNVFKWYPIRDKKRRRTFQPSENTEAEVQKCLHRCWDI